MKPDLRLIPCALLLLAASGAAEAAPEVEPQQYTQSTTSAVCNTALWGPITVTVHHTEGQVNPCQLLDGDFGTTFAIIARNDAAPVRIDLQFPDKRTLTGLRTQTGGYDDYPGEYAYRVAMLCDEKDVIDFPTYFSYSGRATALAFPAPCTTDRLSVAIGRQPGLGGGVEHILELQPVLSGAGRPAIGDDIDVLVAQGLCGAPERLTTGDILSGTGAVVGRIQLWRASCTMAGTTTPVTAFYARSASSVGAPLDMDFMSAHLRLWSSNRPGQTFVSLQNPDSSFNKSNVYVHTGGALSISACASFYPSNSSSDIAATASGCSPAFSQ